jgi:hypothetical protein
LVTGSADQVAELFDRLHPVMSGNMRECIRMGALARLQWADRSQAMKKGAVLNADPIGATNGEEPKGVNTAYTIGDREVTLWELYRFFQEEAFRSRVLAGAPRPVRDAFSGNEARKTTLQAVRVQLRRAAASENLRWRLASGTASTCGT